MTKASNLCQQYQEILEEAKKVLSTAMPVSIVGMYDSGKGHLFGNFDERWVDKNTMVTKIDLSSTYSDLTKTLEAVNLGLAANLDSWKNQNKLEDLKLALVKLLKKQPVLLVFHIGFLETINEDFVLALYNLRNLLGRNINWLIFANYYFLKTTDLEHRNIFEKMFFSHLIKIMPLDKTDGFFAIQRTIPEAVQIKPADWNTIYTLSGGNIGLLRSLVLRYLSEGTILNAENNLEILSRTRKILGELDRKEIAVLLKKNSLPEVTSRLTDFGYLNNNGKIFSPLVEKILYEKPPISVKKEDLTPSQQAIYRLLQEAKGNVVNRDSLASALWSEAWNDKYSDWAIDQAIYSLRQRLLELGSPEKIEAKKGQGFLIDE